ncbi:SRPBCC family protein, partial [Bacillaceae bacterium SIJ1]|uniref:SRPBCC family protein n=1 Tax=Litoribacterium kuwaitense TaxID=1398745 RepID=UPI0013E9A3C4
KNVKCNQFDERIQASIDVVFTYLNEDRHVLQWNTTIVEQTYDGNESDLIEGSTFITKQRFGRKIYSLEVTYTLLDPPYRAELQTKTKEGTSVTKYALRREGNDTYSRVEVYLIPNNWFYKCATKLLKGSFKDAYNEQFE